MSLKLEDLIPQTAEIKLRNLPDVPLKLRPISMADEIWLKQKYGDKIESIFNELKMREICEMVYHQIEDKNLFVKRDIKIVNEDGDEQVIKLGGVELLLMLISGTQEKIEMVQALLQTIGISRPMLEKLASDEEKKNLAIPSTGPKS